MDNCYPKREKLCSKIIIDKLFAEANMFYDFPLKILWNIEPLPEKVPVQSAVTVSKRRFKQAVKRNLLKRRMREAFRVHKHSLYEKVNTLNLQVAVMIIYNHGKIVHYKKIEAAMIYLLKKAVDALDKMYPES